jgi:nucleoside-diphosphate-sugar epimerase
VVVTGCAGFIGSTLCEALVADGRWVVGIDAFTDTYARRDKEANLAGLAAEPRFALVEADLAEDDIARALAGGPPVVHLAGRPGVRSSFGEGFAACLRDNLAATQRLLEAALAAGAPRVVWASSSSVYGDAGPGSAGELRTPTRPVSPYGVTKRACEDLARLARARGIATVALRLFTVYGPRQRPDMAVRRMCEALLGGPPFPLYGDGEQARDLTHVDDAVDAAVRALHAPRPAAAYNVGAGAPASLRGVIGHLEELAGAPLPLVHAGPAPGDVPRTAADTTRARRDLGWRPRVPLRRGLAEQLEWARTAQVAAVGPREDLTLELSVSF